MLQNIKFQGNISKKFIVDIQSIQIKAENDAAL